MRVRVRGGQTLTELTYDGDGCPDHSVSLLEAIGAHGDERVCNRGREQRCIDSNNLGGVVEKEGTVQNKKQEVGSCSTESPHWHLCQLNQRTGSIFKRPYLTFRTSLRA